MCACECRHTSTYTHIFKYTNVYIYIYVILCDAGQHVCTCLGMQISLRVSFSTCMSVCLPACQPAYPPPICLRRSCQRLRGSAAKLLNRAVTLALHKVCRQGHRLRFCPSRWQTNVRVCLLQSTFEARCEGSIAPVIDYCTPKLCHVRQLHQKEGLRVSSRMVSSQIQGPGALSA